MEAKELRIGNLVFFPLKDVPALILRDMFEYQNGLSNLEDYRPIPLTEEWLLRFGFVKVNGVYWTKTRISFEDDNEIGCYNLSESFGGDSISFCNSINYVHQLQNLYFALTGLELTYEQN